MMNIGSLQNEIKRLYNRLNYFDLLMIVFYAALFLFIVQFLRTSFLNYDEAVQFWISKGLNPDSAPLSSEGTLWDVIVNNRHYHFDPGGFGVLLHFWGAFSSHHIWLRLLPFIFFIGTIGSFIYLGYIWSRNITTALISGFVPLFHPIIFSLGFSIRGYSMEILGAVLCLIVIEKLKDKISYQSLFLWSLVLAIMITSRYSMIMVAFCTSLYVVYLIWTHSGSVKQKMSYLIVYSAPLLISVLAIYFITMKYQNPGVSQLGYLPYLNTNLLILLETTSILYIAFIFVGMVLLWFSRSVEMLNKYKGVLYLYVSVNLLFILLSFLGLHPWDPTSMRNISMVTVSILALVAVMVELLKPLLNEKSISKYYILGIALIATLYANKDNLTLSLHEEYNFYEDLIAMELDQYDEIYVDWMGSSYIRYLFEYGVYRNQAEGVYPDKFSLQIFSQHHVLLLPSVDEYSEWQANAPKMSDLNDYPLVIVPMLSGEGFDPDIWQPAGETDYILINTSHQDSE